MPNKDQEITETNTVVIIEDDKGLNRLLAKQLNKRGYKTVSAYNGEQGLEMISSMSDGLLLLDFQLPDTMGDQFIEKMTAKGIQLPFIVMTGHGDEFVAVQMMKCGAIDYIIKDNNLISLLPQRISYAFDIINKDKELLQSQHALQESERKLSTLMKNLPGMAYRCINHPKWPMEYVSFGCVDLTGYSAIELTANNSIFFGDLIHTADKEKVWLKIQAAIKENKTFEMEYRIITKNGKIRWAWERGQMVEQNGRGQILEGFISDITKIKEIEKEKAKIYSDLKKTYNKLEKQTALLAQTEKMSAIGTMAAGVAHELNNPMMGILNFAQYCKIKTDKTDKRFSVLEDIEHEARRCSEIVTNLLTFAHSPQEEKQTYSLQGFDQIINRVIKLLKFRIEKNNVRCIINIDNKTPAIFMQENRMQEVFLNLFTNALDALENSKDKMIQIDIKPHINFIKITFSDNGYGIKKEFTKKIFDPFFTTKPTGKGTGLGMSIIKNYIEEHHGTIKLKDSRQGTVFEISLPVINNNGEMYEQKSISH